jgi:activator of 2-hydroxyglutaryl-CoA dehydratase
MVRSVGVGEGVLLVGGVARNPCMRPLLEARLGVQVTVPERAQFVVALGAALSLI